MKVSIVIPCHDAMGKIEKCISSLETQDFDPAEYEVIFVDDCSGDGTYDYLSEEVSARSNWRLLRKPENSGSPSAPRNLGVSEAVGDYVFFLDCDDEVLIDTLAIHHAYAIANDLCVVRGYLLVDNGSTRIEMNRIADFEVARSKREQIELIIRNQSTTVPSLIRRSLLVESGITWDETLRMGEDTLYLIQVLLASERMGYVNHPTFVYNKSASLVASSTRTYGARELRNHLVVWSSAQRMLGQIGISYVALRFQVGLQTVLQAIVRFDRGDIDRALFGEFSDFVTRHWDVVSTYNLSQRLAALLELLRSDDFDAFFEEAKPRLLVAGYDLKFIDKIIPALSRRFKVRIDEWDGHDSQDADRLRKDLDWAEVIFCEWLLGNAVWYSKHKRPDQRLIVRAHRFELGREFGNRIVHANVDAYITVSVLYFERLLEIFCIERSKIRMVPNYIDADGYASSDDPSRVYNLAIIGSLPSRKGLLKALELLKLLLQEDRRYNLSIYGKSSHDVSWIVRDPIEREYFQKCDEFIEENELRDRVSFKGYVDVTRALADIGFVLSVSDDEWLPESFHIAPADGFAAGGQGVFLRWTGVEYIYPPATIFESIDEIRDYILANREYDEFKRGSGAGRDFIKGNYSPDLFVGRFESIVREFF